MSRWHDPKGWRQRLARRLSFAADRIDPQGAPRSVGWSFTFEQGAGLAWHEGRRQGCPVWYLGQDDYERAHTEASHPAIRIDWATMTVVEPPTPACEPMAVHYDQPVPDLKLGPQGGPWTRHGHPVEGITVEGPGRPPVARCGGPVICDTCAKDAARIRATAKFGAVGLEDVDTR